MSPKKPESRAKSRSWPCSRSICSACVRSVSTGSAGSISRTAARIAANVAAGSFEVRSAKFALPSGCWSAGKVHRRRRGPAQIGVLRVSRDADNLDLVAEVGHAEDQLPAERRLLAEVRAREDLIHHGHLRRVRTVALRESAPEDQRQLHRGEEIGREPVRVDDHRRPRRRRMTRNRERHVLTRAREQRDPRERGRLHPRYGFETLLDARVQRGELLARVAGRRGVDAKQREVATIEACVHLLQTAAPCARRDPCSPARRARARPEPPSASG